MPADGRGRTARPGRGAVRRRAGDPVVRVLLTLTAVLAVVAAVVVVLGEDARVLRLGIIAGLWAALLAVAALVRRDARPDEAEVAAREATLRRTFELEPATEVDARREHELAVRREAAAESDEEIIGLRDELERLRTHLDRVGPRAAPAVGRPWSSGTGGRSVADLLATRSVHGAGPGRRPR
jgi:hypothetical protein